MPSTPTAVLSIDALVAAAGLDVSRGVQVVPAEEAGEANATLATLVLTGAADDPSSLLAKYPPQSEVAMVMDDGEGGVSPGAIVTVAALREAPVWEHSAVVALGLPALPAEEVRNDVRGLVGVIRRLRDPDDGCPWDIAQDHQSLRPHLLEETYEVLEALDALALTPTGVAEVGALREELGDLLMQIVLHARVAEQGGGFSLGEVAEGDPGQAGASASTRVRGCGGGDGGGCGAELGAAEGDGDEGGWGGAGVGAGGGAGGAAGAVAGTEDDGPGVAAGLRVGVGRGCAGEVAGGAAGDRGCLGGGTGRGGGRLAVRGVRLPAPPGGGGGGRATGGVRQVRSSVPGAGADAAGGGGGDGGGGAGVAAGALGAGEGGGGVGGLPAGPSRVRKPTEAEPVQNAGRWTWYRRLSTPIQPKRDRSGWGRRRVRARAI